MMNNNMNDKNMMKQASIVKLTQEQLKLYIECMTDLLKSTIETEIQIEGVNSLESPVVYCYSPLLEEDTKALTFTLSNNVEELKVKFPNAVLKEDEMEIAFALKMLPMAVSMFKDEAKRMDTLLNGLKKIKEIIKEEEEEEEGTPKSNFVSKLVSTRVTLKGSGVSPNGFKLTQEGNSLIVTKEFLGNKVEVFRQEVEKDTFESVVDTLNKEFGFSLKVVSVDEKEDIQPVTEPVVIETSNKEVIAVVYFGQDGDFKVEVSTHGILQESEMFKEIFEELDKEMFRFMKVLDVFYDTKSSIRKSSIIK